LIVSPLSDCGSTLIAGDSAATAMCLISGHEQQVSDARSLFPQLFGFTPAETRLATALLGGLSVSEYSQEVGVSPTTARTHLASLFAKTSTRRQAELIAFLRAACGHFRHSD
jgi:DNA-binding CsgD family transcriptional regulator